MKVMIEILVVVSLFIALTGCATSTVKAPCDNHGHFCGHKTKINQW